jgi:hypothetical protein
MSIYILLRICINVKYPPDYKKAPYGNTAERDSILKNPINNYD